MKHFVLMLPFPISVNAMYGQNRNKRKDNGAVGRFTMKDYKIWKANAAKMFQYQDITYFHNRVDVVIHLNGGNGNSDCDNLIKCCLDFLVKMKVIKNDNKKHLRSVKAIWDDDVTGAMVEIEECN